MKWLYFVIFTMTWYIFHDLDLETSYRNRNIRNMIVLVWSFSYTHKKLHTTSTSLRVSFKIAALSDAWIWFHSFVVQWTTSISDITSVSNSDFKKVFCVIWHGLQKNDFYTSYLSTESKIIYLFTADVMCAWFFMLHFLYKSFTFLKVENKFIF